jgi:hypothetical protein
MSDTTPQEFLAKLQKITSAEVALTKSQIESKIELDEVAIAKSVTACVLESLAAAPESESTPDPEVAEADAVVVSEKTPTLVSDSPQAITLDSETVMLLRAAVRANLIPVVTRVLEIVLNKEN